MMIRCVMLGNLLILLLHFGAPHAAPIIFEGSGEDVRNGVFMLDPEIGEVKALDPAGGDPALSPDGQSVLLVNGDGILTRIRLDRQETLSLGLAGRRPSWSPDGTRIAFVSGGALWVADANGGGTMEVAPRARVAHWSPTTRDVIYYHYGFHIDGSTLNRVNVATGDTAAIVFGAFIPDATYPLSPSGDALLSNRAAAGYHMTVLDLLTGEFSSIGPSGGDGPQSAAWSPGGDYIAYDVRSGTKGLFVCGPRGESPSLVVPGAFDAAPYAPSWAPDGSQLAFHMRNFNGGPDRIHVVNADGSDLRFVAAGRYPIWSPMPKSSVPEDGTSGLSPASWARIKEATHLGQKR